jgi:hypothetical protein
MAQWAKTVTAGNNNSYFNGVSAAADGSVYAAGIIYGIGGTYNFGNGVTAMGTNSGWNILLVKYNSSGEAQWTKTVTAGNNISWFNSVAVNGDGSAVYAAGYIRGTGTYNFGNGVTATGTYSGDSNILLVKYNSSGEAQWAKTVTAGNDISWFNSVAVAADGSVYAAGSIFGTGTYNFGNGVTATGTYISYDS